MAKLSQRISNLRPSAIRLLDRAVARQKGVTFHRLNIGQPDLPTPEPMLRAIREFQPRVVAYGPAPGLAACREAAAAYFSRWCPAGLEADDVAITVGGSEAVLFAMLAFCDPGDEILIPEPFYTNYNGFALMAGAAVRPIPTSIEDGFAIPADDVLDGLVSPRTRMLLFSNPGNPTGVVYPRPELERVVAWARRHGLAVVSDEVYRRIWFEEEPPSVLQLDDPDGDLVCVDSLSKSFSACGIRLGFLISRDRDLMARLEKLGQARLGAQPLAQSVAMAAFALPESYHEEVRRTYKGRVQALVRGVEAIEGVGAVHPDGAFYTMVSLPVSDATAFARFLVEEFRLGGESIVIAPGAGFYADPRRGARQARLAAVVEEHSISRGVEILAAGIEAFRGRGGLD